jgi:hypothetical protein
LVSGGTERLSNGLSIPIRFVPAVLQPNVGWRAWRFVPTMSRSMHVLCGIALLATLALGCRKAAPPPARPDSEAKALVAGERPKTKEACDACQGRWGIHGLAEVELCICKTRDSGRSCRDGADCEGQCLAESNGFVVVDKGPPPKGYFRGRCSEFDTTFGCHQMIMEGASKKGPQLAEDAAEQICID